MSAPQIKNLEELLGLNVSAKIINQKITRLTSPGENYGGMLYAVDITIKTPDGVEEIAAVAKTPPPNAYLQKIFRTHVTFKIENYFYKSIIPALQDFQKEHGVEEVIDFGAKFFGGRVSLNKNTEIVDDDAVILLENLKAANYVNLDRLQGGDDLDVVKLIITDLAYLHAIPIAMKMKQPEMFDEKIKSYLMTNNLATGGGPTNLEAKILKAISCVEDCNPYLARIRKVAKKSPFIASRELFSTISHNDCWLNNTMLKIEDGKAIKNKLIDFQMVDYASLARDLIFFLFTSVKNAIVEQSYDELTKFYYDTFISVLQELDCGTEKFTFDKFLEEIDYEAENTQFVHCAYMLVPMLRPKGTATEISEFVPGEMISIEITDLHKEKIKFLVEQFAKRNWI